MKKALALVLIYALAALANSFAGSGEIRGNAEGMRNISVWQRNNRRMPIFDAGNFLSDDGAQDAALCSLMQRANYSAIALGVRELGRGESFWREMNERFSLPTLATNVRLADGARMFERIRVHHSDNGEKYAIISIFAVENAQISPDFEIEDPQATLELVIPQIPRDHKIVLLAHCDPALTDSLFIKNPRIDFGVQGYKKTNDEPSVLSGTKIILQFGEDGRKIAVLRRGAARWRRFVQSDTPQR